MYRKLMLMMVSLMIGITSQQANAQSADAMYIVTLLEVKPASAKAGVALLRDYVRSAANDAGNLKADAFQEIGRANRLIVVESWKDQSAFAAHEKSSGTLAFRDQFKAIQIAPYDQRVNKGFAIDAATTQAGRNAVYVLTHVDVPGAMREAGEKLLLQLVTPTRQDTGHVRFDVYQQVDPRPNHFNVFAVWNNRSAFEASGGAAHAKQFRDALGPMLGAFYDERLYRRLDN